MEMIIRQAIPQDAVAISELITHALGDEVELSYIQGVLTEGNNTTFVAEVDAKVVGFVDSFLTITQDGARRSELDLLGVHPEYHGRGIGKKLINSVTNEGHSSHVSVIRALVAANNSPMFAAMQKTGFQLQDEICRLYISSAEGKQATLPDTAYLIPVTTLTYRGIWLEGEISHEAIHAANTMRNAQNRDIIGTVIPVSHKTAIQNVESAHFHLIGSYYWWHYLP